MLISIGQLQMLRPADAQQAIDSSHHQPNIVIVFSDDQRADTIQALGNDQIRTPALDALIARGTAMTNAYCMGGHNGAICVPSRAMLLTGRNLFHMNEAMRNTATWPEAFAAAGYDTFITGKWHNGQPAPARVFRHGKAIFLGGMVHDPTKVSLVDLQPGGKLFNRRNSGNHVANVIFDAAIEYLRTPHDKPFLCYVPLNLPHDPRVAPNAYHARWESPDSHPPAPSNFLPQHPFDNGELKIRDELLAPFPRTKKVVRQHLADYYACIEFVDAELGRLLAALDERGLTNNTLVVFAGDHGLAIGSHGLFGKQNLYDQSMHTPLIFAGPGVPQGKRSNALCYLFDILPTLGELAKVPAPLGSEGLSLVPVFNDQATTRRDALYFEYYDKQQAVRDDRWKLIQYPKIGKVQLFDLHNDPHEIHDLSTDPAQADQRGRMTKLLTDQRAAAQK